AELLPGDGLVSGKLTLDVAAEGTGMSAVALMGSLAGSGTFKLENGRVVRLDPAAFDAVMRAVDQGLPIDVTRVRDRMVAALASGLALRAVEQQSRKLEALEGRPPASPSYVPAAAATAPVLAAPRANANPRTTNADPAPVVDSVAPAATEADAPGTRPAA